MVVVLVVVVVVVVVVVLKKFLGLSSPKSNVLLKPPGAHVLLFLNWEQFFLYVAK